LFCAILFAQEEQVEVEESSTMKIGVKGGLSLSSLSDNSTNIYSQGFKSLASYEVGIFAEFGLNDTFGLQVELNYSIKGGERKGLQPIPLNSLPVTLTSQIPAGLVPYGDFENISVLKYLEVPILAKLNFGSTDWRFFANAGPYFGILVGAEQQTSGASQIYADPFGTQPIPLPGVGTTPIPFTAKTDVKDNIKDFNVGIIAGVGVTKDIGPKSQILFEVRGTYGFIAVQENSTFGDSNIGSVLFSLGYAHKL
jgi:hypothetical protein